MRGALERHSGAWGAACDLAAPERPRPRPVVTVVAYVPDLMDRSKVAAAGPTVTFARTPAALVEAAAGAEVVVVDLGRSGVVDVLPAVVATGARVVAFGSHVDRDTLEAARAAGCAEVLPRSRFFASIPQVLGTS